MHALPSFIVDKGVMSMHAGIRKRGLKKDAKIAAEGKKEWITHLNNTPMNDFVATANTPLLVV